PPSSSTLSLHDALPIFYLQCHVLQNFIGRQDPIHRNRMAALCWTTKAQWSVSACAASYLDLPASNNFAANEAVPFLIQRTPRSEDRKSTRLNSSHVKIS